MWRPLGANSWQEINWWLGNIARKIIVETRKPPNSENDFTQSYHLCESLMVKAGQAKSLKEARMAVSLTTLFLLTNLLEQSPPILANIAGSRLLPDVPILAHKDQIELCVFHWPLTEDAQFLGFFSAMDSEGLDPEWVFARFPFIDPLNGAIRRSNGDHEFLINGLGYDEDDATRLLETVDTLKGYFIFWDELPEGRDLRDFLSCIEANAAFSAALDALFGQRTPEAASESYGPNKIGRPKQRTNAAQTYLALFPEGHDVQGLTWQKVANRVSQAMGRRVSAETIKRGIAELIQKPLPYRNNSQN